MLAVAVGIVLKLVVDGGVQHLKCHGLSLGGAALRANYPSQSLLMLSSDPRLKHHGQTHSTGYADIGEAGIIGQSLYTAHLGSDLSAEPQADLHHLLQLSQLPRDALRLGGEVLSDVGLLIHERNKNIPNLICQVLSLRVEPRGHHGREGWLHGRLCRRPKSTVFRTPSPEKGCK